MIKLRKVILASLLVAVVAGGLVFTASSAYADEAGATSFEGRFRKGLESVAEFLGVTTDEIQDARDGGKTMMQFAEEQGVSEEELKDFRRSSAIERWREKGLTEEEIAERLEVLKERQENCDGTPKMGSPFSESGRGSGHKGSGDGRLGTE